MPVSARPLRDGADGAPLFVGVELGGTKCVATLAADEDHIVAQQTIITGHPDRTLPEIRVLIDRWRADHAVRAIGVGSFGPVGVDRTGTDYGQLLATPKADWPRVRLLDRLLDGIDLPVNFDTDVNAAALAEMRWGSGRGFEDFAYVTVGTGVGVGLIVHGRPTRGIGHSEAGHLRVPRVVGDVGPSGCPFHSDCVEGLAAGPGIQAALGELPLPAVPPDHPVWNRVVGALAAMGHALLATTGPQRIAIGGGVISRQPHLLPRIEAAMRTSLNGYLRLPDAGIICAPELGDQAGPLGTIALAADAAPRINKVL